MAAIEIAPVASSGDLKQFIELPWKIYRDEPNWVPPLKSDVRHLLDVQKHPFWKFSQRELFLARRNGETVGRIAAIVDNNYNQFHKERMGVWGFFECQRDPEAAQALFAAAQRWVASKEMNFLRGPLNPSTNYEIGMLIEGFEYPPAVMMTYNPRYYPELVEQCGFTKEKDLVALLIDSEKDTNPRVARLAARILRNHKITIQSGDRKKFAEQLQLVKELYNASWELSWGFAPLTEAEIDELGKTLLKILDPDLVLLFFYEDDPAGVCIILPDINPLLKRFNGKIGLLGPIKYLLYRREIVGLRGMVFGFKPEYRKLGLPLVAFDHLSKIITSKKYKYFELGWNLEDNRDINNFDADLGGREYKRYRIYRKEL